MLHYFQLEEVECTKLRLPIERMRIYFTPKASLVRRRDVPDEIGTGWVFLNPYAFALPTFSHLRLSIEIKV